MLTAMLDAPIKSIYQIKPNGIGLRIKAVPGASRSRVMGLLGDRLKIAVASPPEAGKANKALCKLLAKTFGLSSRDVAVVAGMTCPLKTVLLTGIDEVALVTCLESLISR